MLKSLFTKKTLSKQPSLFRIEAIISDGMWYSIPKWKAMSNVTESELTEYIDKALKDGTIVQSPTGLKSYRMPVDSIKKWYKKNGFNIHKEQLLDFVFPPRIWNNKTEPEGFLEAPVREVGIVSFIVNDELANFITNNLKGIAKVREVEPGKYKAYGLNSTYIKNIISESIEEYVEKYQEEPITKVYGRQISSRREMVDFDSKFAKELVLFYRNFGKTLVKTASKTINIFIPNPEEQDAQVLTWVLEAIEKFDESASVPFSGYLDTVLKRWPYNLPNTYLGKELSQFQKNRAKAINDLRAEEGEEKVFTHEQIAKKMKMPFSCFSDLEEKHKAWIGIKNAESLVWEDKGEEKSSNESSSLTSNSKSAKSDHKLSHKISLASIEAALDTGKFSDFMALTSQIDSGNIDFNSITKLDKEFVKSFGDKINI